MSRKWTVEEEFFVKHGYLKLNLTYKEIADELERSVVSVHQKIKKLNLSTMKKQEEIELLKRGKKKCKTCNEILTLEYFDKKSNSCLVCNDEKRKQARLEKEKEEMITIKEKFCPKCETIKSFTEFYISRKRYDGLESICKVCKKEGNNKSDNKRLREKGWR